MIRLSMKALLNAAISRPNGYLEEVLSAASEVHEHYILVTVSDYEKLAYKHSGRTVLSSDAISTESQHGPGTELKKLLKKVGITASPDCSCNARARLMDERGIEWCEANLDEIVGWLREEATKRGLPFVDMAGRMLVKRAIKNARRADGHRAD